MSMNSGSTALSRGSRGESSGAASRGVLRSPTAWWLASAAAAAVATWIMATSGRPTFAWIFAFVALMSLYGSVDHLVEPVAGELLATGSTDDGEPAVAADDGIDLPAALGSRQRRVLRFLAYGLPVDEIAELLKVDEPSVKADIAGIAAVLADDGRSQAVVATRAAVVGDSQSRRARPAA